MWHCVGVETIDFPVTRLHLPHWLENGKYFDEPTNKWNQQQILYWLFSSGQISLGGTTGRIDQASAQQLEKIILCSSVQPWLKLMHPNLRSDWKLIQRDILPSDSISSKNIQTGTNRHFFSLLALLNNVGVSPYFSVAWRRTFLFCKFWVDNSVMSCIETSAGFKEVVTCYTFCLICKIISIFSRRLIDVWMFWTEFIDWVTPDTVCIDSSLMWRTNTITNWLTSSDTTRRQQTQSLCSGPLRARDSWTEMISISLSALVGLFVVMLWWNLSVSIEVMVGV